MLLEATCLKLTGKYPPRGKWAEVAAWTKTLWVGRGLNRKKMRRCKQRSKEEKNKWLVSLEEKMGYTHVSEAKRMLSREKGTFLSVIEKLHNMKIQQWTYQCRDHR